MIFLLVVNKKKSNFRLNLLLLNNLLSNLRPIFLFYIFVNQGFENFHGFIFEFFLSFFFSVLLVD